MALVDILGARNERGAEKEEMGGVEDEGMEAAETGGDVRGHEGEKESEGGSKEGKEEATWVGS